jgi:hypothetical protein
MSRHKEPWTLKGKIEVKGLSNGMIQVSHPGVDPGRWVGYNLDLKNAHQLLGELNKAIEQARQLEKESKERQESADAAWALKTLEWRRDDLRDDAIEAQERREAKV